jgi:hypothetical protein
LSGEETARSRHAERDWGTEEPGVPNLELSPTRAEDEDDSGPYGLVGGPERLCPECDKVLAPEDEVCVACGFNLRTGQKAVKVYEPLQRQWEAGLSYYKRLAIFLAGQGLSLVLGLIFAVFGGWRELGPFLVSWMFFSTMLGFLLGTYDRINLTRNKRGQVRLTKSWRIFFWPGGETVMDLRGYESVMTSRGRGSDFWDWIILLSLCSFGCLPALLWWYFAIHRDTAVVALTRDHGFPEQVLYHGWNEEQAVDIAVTLRDTAGLPYNMN